MKHNYIIHSNTEKVMLEISRARNPAPPMKKINDTLFRTEYQSNYTNNARNLSKKTFLCWKVLTNPFRV